MLFRSDSTLARVENTTLQNLQTSNLLINTISQIAIGNAKSSNSLEENMSEITKVKLNNGTKIILKILAVISAITIAYIGGKYSISVK